MVADVSLPQGEANSIKEVTLFLNQAYVKRVGKAEVGAGLSRILLEVSAFRVDPESVQAQVFGDGQLLGVQYKVVPVKEAPQVSVRELDGQRRDIKHRLQQQQQAIEVIDKQSQFLDSTLTYADAQVPREIKTEFPKADELAQILDFLDNRYSTLAERREESTREIENLNRELAVLDRRLKRTHRNQRSEMRVIEVLFETDEAQQIRIEAAYSVFQAKWTPTYRVEVAETLDNVQLTQFAHIEQNTGEDWSDIRLSVSNAAPTLSMQLPRPASWVLRQPQSVFPQVVAAGAVEENMGEMGDAGGEDVFDDVADLDAVTLGGIPEPAAALFVEAEQRATPISFEYELPRKVGIPSGGDEAILPIRSTSLTGEYYHHIVPRFDQRAYLVCEMPGDPNLLPGRLNVHFAGRYVAGTQLGALNAGEPVLLNLGVDRSVLVKRESVIDKLAEKFFGVVDRGHVARELEYRIQVENLGNREVNAQLFDSVPVSQTDRFQVKGVELNPNPDSKDWDGREGVMRWNIEVAPSQSEIIRMHFFVKYPRDERPDGL